MPVNAQILEIKIEGRKFYERIKLLEEEIKILNKKKSKQAASGGINNDNDPIN